MIVRRLMAAAKMGKQSKSDRQQLNGNSSTNYASHLPSGPQSTHIAPESIKVIAEQVGIASLQDGASKFLADEVTTRLRQVLVEAVKFQGRAKRRKVLSDDIDCSLRVLNVEPVYGFQTSSSERGLPFRFASGGGRELVFVDAEKEVDLLKLATNAALPKVPPDVSLKSHWLSIEGVQPAIPENPPPVSKSEQRLESIDPLSASTATAMATASSSSRDKINKKKRLETVKVKQYATHELSVEQQLYYKVRISNACCITLFTNPVLDCD